MASCRYCKRFFLPFMLNSGGVCRDCLRLAALEAQANAAAKQVSVKAPAPVSTSMQPISVGSLSASGYSRIEVTERKVAESKGNFKPITNEDMKQFTMLPYKFDRRIRNNPSANPSSFMELGLENQNIAAAELSKINSYIRESHSLSYCIPKSISIPINKMIYSPVGEYAEYTKLVCTPYTATGKLSKYPAYLYFSTAQGYLLDETHGQLYYSKDGSISKAKVCIWLNGNGYFFYFKTVGQTFVMHKIESTVGAELGVPNVIYKSVY